MKQILLGVGIIGGLFVFSEFLVFGIVVSPVGAGVSIANADACGSLGSCQVCTSTCQPQQCGTGCKTATGGCTAVMPECADFGSSPQICAVGVNGQTGATCRQCNSGCSIGPVICAEGCVNAQGCSVLTPSCPLPPNTTGTCNGRDSDCNVAAGEHCVPIGSAVDYHWYCQSKSSSCVAGENGVGCCSDSDCNVTAGAHCYSAGYIASRCTFSNVTSTPGTFISGTSGTPDTTNSGAVGSNTNSSNSNPNNSIAAVIGGLEHSILTYRVSAAAQLQAQTNAAIGNGNTGAITSQTTATQRLLTALRSSLQDISSALRITGTVSSSVLTSVNGVLTSIAQIIQSLQTNGTSIISTTVGITTTTASNGALIDFSSTKIGGIATSSFRYLAIRSRTTAGWLITDQIEGYDMNGNKVQPVSINRNNAERTNLSIFYTVGTTWAVVDFGSVMRFSKVRFLDNGPWYTDDNEVFVSSDGKIFSRLWTFSDCPNGNQILDSNGNILSLTPDTSSPHPIFSCNFPQWYEYDFPSYSADPSITVLVNGKSSATVNVANTGPQAFYPQFDPNNPRIIVTSSDPFFFSVNASNADYLLTTISGSTIYPQMGYLFDRCDYQAGWQFLDPSPFHGLIGEVSMPSTGWSSLDHSYPVPDSNRRDGCPVDRYYDLTMTAVQSMTGKQATSSAHVLIPGAVPLIAWWYPLSISWAGTDVTGVTAGSVDPHYPLSSFSTPASLNSYYDVTIPVGISSATVSVNLRESYQIAFPTPIITLLNYSPLKVSYIPKGSTTVNMYTIAGEEIGKLQISVPVGGMAPQQFQVKADGPGGSKMMTVFVKQE